ncbi:MAG: polyphosphate kinase 1 [Bdellovibrionales bacterium]|nr:polyphosphate kinase 1 [Bdellovibrionales bacterium]
MSDRFFNRDLSWLEFNRRVLHQARDPSHPLLERVRFLSIFTSNLDEFFMKRVGYLQRLEYRGVPKVGSDEVSPKQLLHSVRQVVQELVEARARCFHDELMPELEKAGVALVPWKGLSNAEKELAAHVFRTRVFPVLTPLAVDPAHPFPFLSNLSVSLGVKLHHPKTKQGLFARIKIPDVLPQWIRLNPDDMAGGYRFLALRELIEHHLEEFFPEMVVENVTAFRVTRNADIDQVKDEAEDLLDRVEEELRLRRMADIVRVEHGKNADPWVLKLLKTELELGDDDLYENQELFYRNLTEIANLNMPALRFKPWVPVTPAAFSEEGVDMFRVLREQDVLVHHPYESFSGSVERFVRAAAEDPQVLALKIVLYRSGSESPLIPLLIRAAEKGKQVVCVVELQARFDEARNVYSAEVLEKSGVHVVYGVVGLKTHAKVALVVRQEEGQFRLYAHVGTGNYNADTAKLYTDFGLFTADPKLTNELIEVFNYLTGLSLKRNYRKFLVAPVNMRERFMDFIRKETDIARAGGDAQIIAKMNSLEDHAVCEALYEASQAGVSVELIVRGFCCLRPGVKGLSDKVRVHSAIGRFLEHSRVFYFRQGAKEPVDGKFLIGSADWMYRNLNNRVEIVAPVEAKENRRELWDLLRLMLSDRVQTWDLRPDGSYLLRSSGDESAEAGIHELLLTRARSRGTKPPGSR